MLELIEILTPLHQYCDGKTVFSIFDICIQQDTVHGLCPSGKSIPSCTVTCHLVGSSQTWHWRVTGATHTELVWKCQKQSVFWLQPEWSVKCESGCSPRLLPEPPPLLFHLRSGSPHQGVSYRMSLGKPVWRWPGPGLHELQRSGKDICAVCPKGIGINSISCGGCLVGFTRNTVVSQVQV